MPADHEQAVTSPARDGKKPKPKAGGSAMAKCGHCLNFTFTKVNELFAACLATTVGKVLFFLFMGVVVVGGLLALIIWFNTDAQTQQELQDALNRSPPELSTSYLTMLHLSEGRRQRLLLNGTAEAPDYFGQKIVSVMLSPFNDSRPCNNTQAPCPLVYLNPSCSCVSCPCVPNQIQQYASLSSPTPVVASQLGLPAVFGIQNQTYYQAIMNLCALGDKASVPVLNAQFWNPNMSAVFNLKAGCLVRMWFTPPLVVPPNVNVSIAIMYDLSSSIYGVSPALNGSSCSTLDSGISYVGEWAGYCFTPPIYSVAGLVNATNFN